MKMPRRRSKTNRKPGPATAGRRSRGRVKAPGSMVPQTISPLVHQVCSITDPFCSAAWGAKIPDGACSRSIATTYEKLHTLTSDANGNIAFLAVPELVGSNALLDSIDNSFKSATFSAFAVDNYDTNAKRWRMVSFGAEVSSIVAPLSASGMVHLRTFSPYNYKSLSQITINTVYADSMRNIPTHKLANEKIISKRLGTEALLFHDVVPITFGDSEEDSSPIPGYQVIFIGATGLPPNTPCLVVRTVRHIEYVPSDGSSSYAFASKPPKPNSAVIQQSATTLSNVGNYLGEKASQVIHSDVAQSFGRRALGWGVNAAANYLFGPAGGTVAGLLTNGAVEVD